MKIAKFFAALFAVLGVILLLGTTVISFASINAPARVLETPAAAVSCADRLVAALDSGDLPGAAALMYGQPDLGAEGVPEDAASAQLWEIYLEEMACAPVGKLQANGSDFVRKVTVTVLDVNSITGSVQTRAKVLLEQQVAAATDMAQLYDGNGNFRQALIDQVMQEALEQAIREDAGTVTFDASFRVICREGQWWAVPDQALLNALSLQAA